MEAVLRFSTLSINPTLLKSILYLVSKLDIFLHPLENSKNTAPYDMTMLKILKYRSSL